MTPAAGTVGVYTSRARWLADHVADAAAELDTLGYAAAWVADTRGELGVLDEVLAGSTALTVGTAIQGIWDRTPAELAAWWNAADAAHPGRALLGLGVSHAPLVERMGGTYARPFAAMQEFLTALDGEHGVPAASRLLGANGPKMVELAATRAAGALTYLVTPERTAEHRAELGDAFLAPEVKVVLAGDREAMREAARAHLGIYLTLPNYVGNLRRMGFSDDDIAGRGSDRLVDALVAGPSPDDVVARVAQYRAAGADHVALQVIVDHPALPRAEWRTLAEALDLTATTAGAIS